VTDAGREVKVVPIPKTQASPFSKLGPERAHINESIDYVRELSESFPTRLVPQIAGTWVFFETRYLMFVSNINQSLRGIAKLIAKRNGTFVRPGKRRQSARASFTSKSVRIARGLRCPASLRVTIARRFNGNTFDNSRRNPSCQNSENDRIQNVELRSVFDVDLDRTTSFYFQSPGEVPRTREDFEEDSTMPSRAKCGAKSFSKSASYRSASRYTLGREANRIAEI
jgi:hypothetical protein